MVSHKDDGNAYFCLTTEPLTAQAFAQFGSVIGNPRPDVHPANFSSPSTPLPTNAHSANQGTAIQYREAGRVQNFYDRAPSRRGRPVVSVFVCAPSVAFGGGCFKLRVLERHPYTTQLFAPLASSAPAYLVIVAPCNKEDRPDLGALRAFVASKAQAVMYAAGTWHAPMVVLGEVGQTLDFVVSQFASGEEEEDCQMIEIKVDVDVQVTERSPSLKL